MKHRGDRMSSSVLLVVMLTLGVRSQKMIEVEMKQGTIFAYEEETEIPGRSFYSFMNIPYAQPPVGDLRLQDPVPAGPWEGRRNGSVVPTVCPQLDFLNFIRGIVVIKGGEDCLYLNVFTPKPIRGSNLPVMITIHGDGFFLGSGDEYPPWPLMKKDVVYISLNYRINVLGFLSTQDGVIPGNQGLKDMTMAFRWIQDNIRDLGGDPSRVTVFGSGTGSVSSHYHALIPQNEGLIHRVIMQSGTVLSPGYVNLDPRGTAVAVGKKLGCPGMDSVTAEDLDSQALLSCLKETPAETLAKISNEFYDYAIIPLLFVPCVDGDYLPDHPAKLVKEGRYLRIPMMSGTTRNQGALNTRPLFGQKHQAEDMRNHFSRVAPLAMYLFDEEDPVYLTKRAYYYYVGNLSISEHTADALTQMFGERRWTIGLEDTALFHSHNAADGEHFYMYELQHRGLGTFGGFHQLPFGDHWIAHGDDLQYIFNDISFYPALQRDEDIMVSDIMLSLWTNFAATGNPTPDQSLGFRWAPVNGSCLHYLAITPSPRMVPNTRGVRMEFWRNMPIKLNMILYPERFAPDYLPEITMNDPCAPVS